MRRRQFTSAALGGLAVPFAAASGGGAARAAASVHEPAPIAPDGVPAAFFGMHFHRLFPRLGERMATRWPDPTIGSLRLWDSITRWADLAPYRGRWDFERLDAHVELAEAHGSSLLYTLGSTPRWASARPDEAGPYGPGCAAEPLAMADWQEYVERVVARYRGRIATYEVWNEPLFSELPRDRGQPGFFTGSVAQMIEMTRIARAVIDRGDRAARLATPGFVNGAHRLDLFLAQGGARLVDVIAYHFYAADAAQFASQVAEVRAVMAKRGVAAMPLWNTESGVEQATPKPGTAGHGAAGAELAADRLAQYVLLGAATRLQRFYYHAWDNDLTGMVDREGIANSRALAYARVQRWLLGARVGAPARLPGGGYRIDAVRGSRRIVMAWSDAGESFSPAVPAGMRVDAIEPSRGSGWELRMPVLLSAMPVACSFRPVHDAVT